MSILIINYYFMMCFKLRHNCKKYLVSVYFEKSLNRKEFGVSYRLNICYFILCLLKNKTKTEQNKVLIT